MNNLFRNHILEDTFILTSYLFSFIYFLFVIISSCAGFIESDMTKDLDTEKLLPFIPLKRFGTAEEVAGQKLLPFFISIYLSFRHFFSISIS